MMLYLIQHGEAVEKSLDSDRPLTAEGRDAVIRVADFARQAGVCASAVWHSGKTRAAQTAEIVAARWAPGVPAEAHGGLNPKDDASEVAQELKRCEFDLAIVGHLPHLSRLVSLLISGKPDCEVVAFQRGGAIALERGPRGEWRINWVLPPSLAPR